MDTSKTFIKMCNCEEIQSRKRHSVLTHYRLDTGKTIDIHGDYITWVDIDVADYTPEQPDKPIWLPTQSQLQEMVKDNYDFACDDFELVELFYNFVWGDNPQWDELGITSMEQLWLAFVMSQFHQKRWDGEKWQ